jgi:glycosyltransferase involved in cell wall biosynthesis
MINSISILEDLSFLIDCFLCLVRERPDVQLKIKAGGIYRDALVNRIEHASCRQIRLLPWSEPDTVPGYMNTIDIGILALRQTTKVNRAKSPTKLFEYMAMKKPVISTSFGEISHIIRNRENGMLADKKEDFVAAMKELMDSPALRHHLAENALDDIRTRYSLHTAGETLASLLYTHVPAFKHDKKA